MASITTRAGKGSPLTNAELDANFNNINAQLSTAVITGGTIDGATIGATTATTGKFSQLDVDNLRLDGNTISSTDTNGNVTIAPNGTGTVAISNATVISTTDNTNAALRITQLGTGNALLVEDSANPDATPVVVDNTGKVIVGYTASIDLGNTTNIQSYATGASSGVTAVRWSNDVIAPRLQVGKSRSATIGTNTIVQSGDALGGLYFYGDDGTDLISTAASIIVSVDGTPGANDMPGRLTFSTTADGASSPTERMRIDSAGNVGIGATAPVTKLEVAGSNNSTWSATTTSISGTTMTIAGTVTGTIAIGDLVYGTGVQPYTQITAGSALSWTVSVSQTVTSATLVGGATYSSTLIRITETDSAVSAGQPTGALQFYTSDATAPTAGVGAYVAAVAEDTSPDTALIFGTRDDAGGGVDANERLRITSAGNVGIGTTSPAVKLAVDSTDAILIPKGTTAQRPTGATGYFRYNTDLSKAELYNGTAWGSVGGGATGAGGDEIFIENGQTVTTSYSIGASRNAMSTGPISVSGGVVVTVPTGSRWVVL